MPPLSLVNGSIQPAMRLSGAANGDRLAIQPALTSPASVQITN